MHPNAVFVPLLLATRAQAAVMPRLPTLNHFALQDALVSPASINLADNTCGPHQGVCDPKSPGGGWCCSVHVITLSSTYLSNTDVHRAIVVTITLPQTRTYVLTFAPGNSSEYCGEGCQDEYGSVISTKP